MTAIIWMITVKTILLFHEYNSHTELLWVYDSFPFTAPIMFLFGSSQLEHFAIRDFMDRKQN